MSTAKSRSSGKSRTKRKRSTSKAKRTRGPLVPLERKKEIFGLILMGLAVLAGLAVLSYAPVDDGYARAFSFADMVSPGAVPVQNALGIVGALLAWLLVPNLIGYPSLLLAVVVFLWGYALFRHKPGGRLGWWSLGIVCGALLVACFLGWIAHAFATDMDVWSGAVGLGVSGFLVRAFGVVGSFIVLFVLSAILLLLVVDHDIQRSIDRLDLLFNRIRLALTDRKNRWAAERQQRREQREAERAAYEAEQEKRRKALEAKKAEEEKRRQAEREARSVRAKKKPSARPESPASPTESTARTPAPSSPAVSGQVSTLNDLFRKEEAAPNAGPSAPPKSNPTAAPPPSPPTRPAKPAAASAQKPEPPSAEPAVETAGTAPEVEFHVRERTEEQKANLDDRKPQPDVRDLPYSFPSVELLEPDDNDQNRIDYAELEEKKQQLLDKLDMHRVQLSNIEAIVGPTVTLYELTPAPGVKISQIKSLENDLAMAMAARGIRMIVPIPGKSAVGVEIPNRYRELVRIRAVLNTARFRDNKMELPIILGKTIENELFMQDLAQMPHLLIAGATGAGKSVALNCYIATLLYACHPANLKFVMVDPKKIELPQYAKAVDHFIAMPEDADEPITTDFMQALGVLKSCLKEMELRYDLLSDAGVRSIKEYNRRLRDGRIDPEDGHRHLPYIVVIIDELADLMMTAGKEIEGPVARLAQMARAVGIHLMIATQRPSVNVITGLIKANFPARIAFQVASGIDSRTIIDQHGAEQLVGNGDLLFMRGSQIKRLQSPFISLEEVEALTDFIGDQPGAGPYLLPPMQDEAEESDTPGLEDADRDDLFVDAARIIVRTQQGSVSLLQRKLSVGYTRAARIVDQLEDAGIVGPFEGSKARQVLIPSEIELDSYLKGTG